jgi:hypothetical protein
MKPKPLIVAVLAVLLVAGLMAMVVVASDDGEEVGSTTTSAVDVDTWCTTMTPTSMVERLEMVEADPTALSTFRQFLFPGPLPPDLEGPGSVIEVAAPPFGPEVYAAAEEIDAYTDDLCGSGRAGDPSTTTSAAVTTVDQAGPTQDEVLSDWVASDPDLSGAGPYLGPCPTEFDADFPQEGLCSVVQLEDVDRVIYGLGPPFSEIVIYVLVVDADGGWEISDSYFPADPYDLSDAPAWLSD